MTGATGALGPALIEALLDQGYRVRAMTRSKGQPWPAPATVQVVTGDLNDQRSLSRALTGVDVVFHLAAKLHTETSNADAALRQEYQRVNVVGTRNLAQMAVDVGVRRFVFFSTIAVYGASHAGAPFTEDSPVLGDTLYASTKLEGEAVVRAVPGSVILRIAATYGPRMKANYRRLAHAVQRRRFVSVGPGRNRRTLIHEIDVARAAMLAASHAPDGSTYNVTDGRVHTLREVLAAISAAVDRKLWPGYLPTAPTRALAGVLEDGFRLLGQTAPLGRGTIDKLTEDVAVSGQRFQNDLGFRPSMDLLAGWRQAVGSWTR